MQSTCARQVSATFSETNYFVNTSPRVRLAGSSCETRLSVYGINPEHASPSTGDNTTHTSRSRQNRPEKVYVETGSHTRCSSRRFKQTTLRAQLASRALKINTSTHSEAAIYDGRHFVLSGGVRKETILKEYHTCATLDFDHSWLKYPCCSKSQHLGYPLLSFGRYATIDAAGIQKE